MTCLAAKLFDPAVAVSKSTVNPIAMTALDTTNLRLIYTAPMSGRVLVRLAATIHGSATVPQTLLGVMDGANVVARMPPVTGGGTMAATTLMRAEATFVVDGLTPGAQFTWDAAYGVETGVSSTALKYGGPNTSTANNAFGAFQFEIWSA